MKLLPRIFGALVGVLVVSFIGFNVAIAAFRDRLFDLNVHRLDAWVAKPDPKAVQTVVENCGQLVMAQAGWFERIQLMTYLRDELDFRVDVCTKITANRVSKQPEFDNPEIVKMICWDPHPYHRVFVRLCEHAGLRPAE